MPLESKGRFESEVRRSFASAMSTGYQLPASAPELWQVRDKQRRENPIEFAARVYSKWLAKGLTRRHLRDLDRPLYTALAKWLEREKAAGREVADELTSFTGKSRSVEVDRELRTYDITDPTEAYTRFPADSKMAERLYQAALSRRKKRQRAP